MVALKLVLALFPSLFNQGQYNIRIAEGLTESFLNQEIDETIYRDAIYLLQDYKINDDDDIANYISYLENTQEEKNAIKVIVRVVWNSIKPNTVEAPTHDGQGNCNSGCGNTRTNNPRRYK